MPDTAPDDPELERLLDALVSAGQDVQLAYAELGPVVQGIADRALDDTSRAVLAYLERAYVRREIPAADACHCPRCGAAHRSKDAADAR